MKIGIITYHNALNAGAILQAYALQSLLKQFGHHVEFIDFAPPRNYKINDFIAKSPSKIIHKWIDFFNYKKYSSKKKSFNKVLNLSAQKYYTLEELKNNPPIYDIYIAGSDQIWNFTTFISPAYMLSFVPKGKKKIAYAASMGQCNLDPKLYETFKRYISDFNAISIREKNGVEFLKKLVQNQIDIIQVLDPTLLINADIYEKIIDPKIINHKPFICTYILSDLDLDNKMIISCIKQEKKLEIINLRNPDTGVYLSKAQNIIVTPYQWLSYIKYSNFIICSSFHAVVFALIFHKPFIALVPPGCKNKNGNARINSLLESIDLAERIIYHFHEESLKNIINKAIPWEIIDAKIKSQRITSINFILNNLK